MSRRSATRRASWISSPAQQAPLRRSSGAVVVELQRNADHLVAGALHQRRGNSRIDAARHRHDHAATSGCGADVRHWQAFVHEDRGVRIGASKPTASAVVLLLCAGVAGPAHEDMSSIAGAASMVASRNARKATTFGTTLAGWKARGRSGSHGWTRRNGVDCNGFVNTIHKATVAIDKISVNLAGVALRDS